MHTSSKRSKAYAFFESDNDEEKLEGKVAWEYRSWLGKARLSLFLQTLGEENGFPGVRKLLPEWRHTQLRGFNLIISLKHRVP